MFLLRRNPGGVAEKWHASRNPWRCCLCSRKMMTRQLQCQIAIFQMLRKLATPTTNANNLNQNFSSAKCHYDFQSFYFRNSKIWM